MAIATRFLSSIRGFVQAQDGQKLSEWLRVEPPLPQEYYELGKELRTGFANNSKTLEALVEKCLPQEDNVPDGAGTAWPGFVSFIKDYLEFWRDIDFADLLATHELLGGLV